MLNVMRGCIGEVEANFEPIFDAEVEELSYERMEECPMEQIYYIAIFRWKESNYWHVHGVLFDTKEELLKAMRRIDNLADVKIILVSLPIILNNLI